MGAVGGGDWSPGRSAATTPAAVASWPTLECTGPIPRRCPFNSSSASSKRLISSTSNSMRAATPTGSAARSPSSERQRCQVNVG